MTEPAADASDAAVFEERMADLMAGQDAVLPVEVSAALLKGATLLSALRQWRGLTQRQLADRAGLGEIVLAELETGAKSGPRKALENLAAALDVPADWLAGADNEGA